MAHWCSCKLQNKCILTPKAYKYLDLDITVTIITNCRSAQSVSLIFRRLQFIAKWDFFVEDRYSIWHEKNKKINTGNGGFYACLNAFKILPAIYSATFR